MTELANPEATMARIPRWLPSVAVGALLLGAGVAAASTGGSGGIEVAEESSTTLATEPSTTTTVVSAPEGTVPDAEDGDSEPNGTPRYWGPECGENPTNHGGYVRRAEQDGTSRSEAAHSPCGRPLSSVKVTTTTASSSPGDEAELPGIEPENGAAPAPPGPPPNHGGGNGNGNGNGGGHGNGKGGKK